MIDENPYRAPDAVADAPRSAPCGQGIRWAFRIVGVLMVVFATLMIIGYPLVLEKRIQDLDGIRPGFWVTVAAYFAMWMVLLVAGAGFTLLRSWSRLPGMLGGMALMAYGWIGILTAIVLLGMIFSRQGRVALGRSEN